MNGKGRPDRGRTQALVAGRQLAGRRLGLWLLAGMLALACWGGAYASEAGESYVDFGTHPPTSLEELESFLALSPGLRKLDMYDFSISVEDMEDLMARYPQVEFGWTVPVNKSRPLPSNATAYSTRHSRLIKQQQRNTWEDFTVLAHCPGLLALDLGHSAIDDLSFLRAFKGLKVLILADNQITDLTVLGELTELEYLELFMNDITDLTPLTKLTKLKDLNICYNKVTDITPLLSMTSLERLWVSHNKIPKADRQRLVQALPGTKVNITARLSTQEGWRTHDRYDVIKAMFKGFTYIPFEE